MRDVKIAQIPDLMGIVAGCKTAEQPILEPPPPAPTPGQLGQQRREERSRVGCVCIRSGKTR